MAQQQMQICFVILFVLLNSAIGGHHQRRLLKHLFDEQQHNPLERPVGNATDDVSVDIKFALIKLIDCDVKNQVITTNFWITQKWQDYSMKWIPDDYGNITKISVPSTKIWLPDVTLYNNVDKNYDHQMKTNVVIKHTGDILYVSPTIFKSTCPFNFTSSVFTCMLKFGSWTYDNSKVALTFPGKQVDTSSYIVNEEWKLIDASVVNVLEKYDCCPEIYQSVNVMIKLRRQHSNEFSINVNGTENEDA